MLRVPRYLRLLLSYAVAASAAGMCAVLNHVYVSWRNPSTWSHVLQHRCGRLMLVCAAWALVEMLLALWMPRERESSPFRPLRA